MNLFPTHLYTKALEARNILIMTEFHRLHHAINKVEAVGCTEVSFLFAKLLNLNLVCCRCHFLMLKTTNEEKNYFRQTYF